jgi:hypothetical protein
VNIKYMEKLLVAGSFESGWNRHFWQFGKTQVNTVLEPHYHCHYSKNKDNLETLSFMVDLMLSPSQTFTPLLARMSPE